MLSEFASNVVADISNIGLHFLHPITKHEHTCACLICSAYEIDPNKHTTSHAMTTLIPLATPSDLDLVKTGSKSIRQLVIFGDVILNGCSAAVRQFCAELKTHLNYHVNFGIPKINSNTPYHVLVFLVCEEQKTKHAAAWFMNVISKQHAKRAVVICSENNFKQFIQPDVSNITLLAYENLQLTLQALTHGMMVTKQRLMPKDLVRFMPSKQTHVTSHIPQPGMCLFL